jgi:[protein-PII] uridylyltransferase
LYDLATAITSNGGNIEVVLIDTQAHKAIDVFYVTLDGAKLTAEVQETIGEALRQVCQPVLAGERRRYRATVFSTA